MNEHTQAALAIVGVLTVVIAYLSSHMASLKQQCREHGHLWRDDDHNGGYYCARCGDMPHAR